MFILFIILHAGNNVEKTHFFNCNRIPYHKPKETPGAPRRSSDHCRVPSGAGALEQPR